MVNRAGEPDLYYGFFGLECMQVVGMPLDVDFWCDYLTRFELGPKDDLVHLSCLIRCWANMPKDAFSPSLKEQFSNRLKGFMSEDGAFHTLPKQAEGSAYGCFVALDTFHNLDMDCPNKAEICKAILAVQTPTGAFAFQAGLPEGTTPTTAAAAVGSDQTGPPQK